MVKKKGETILNAQKIKPELKALKEKKKTIDQKIKPKKHPKKETKIKKAEIQKLDKTKTKKTNVIFVVILPIVVESENMMQLFVHLVLFQKTNFWKFI